MNGSSPFVWSTLIVVGVGCTPAHSDAVLGPAEAKGRGYEWPPRTAGHDENTMTATQETPTAPRGAKTLDESSLDQASTATQPAPRRARIPTPEPLSAPVFDPTSCLEELERRRVAFTHLEELRGVEVPVRIHGPLGGITFYVNGNGPLEMDCRLAVALDRLAPIFEAHGVVKARFSGAYVYKRTRSGRLSHHAHGLALDLHDFVLDGQPLSVEDDFERGLGCSGDVPQLNSLVCDLRRTRLFEEFLTPNYNAAHHDHLHISVPHE